MGKYGQVSESGTIFLWVHIGTAQATVEGKGYTFELSTSMTGSPNVRCNETGKTFRLTWQDIIEMAIERTGLID